MDDSAKDPIDEQDELVDYLEKPMPGPELLAKKAIIEPAAARTVTNKPPDVSKLQTQERNYVRRKLAKVREALASLKKSSKNTISAGILTAAQFSSGGVAADRVVSAEAAALANFAAKPNIVQVANNGISHLHEVTHAVVEEVSHNPSDAVDVGSTFHTNIANATIQAESAGKTIHAVVVRKAPQRPENGSQLDDPTTPEKKYTFRSQKDVGANNTTLD